MNDFIEKKNFVGNVKLYGDIATALGEISKRIGNDSKLKTDQIDQYKLQVQSVENAISNLPLSDNEKFLEYAIDGKFNLLPDYIQEQSDKIGNVSTLTNDTIQDYQNLSNIEKINHINSEIQVGAVEKYVKFLRRLNTNQSKEIGQKFLQSFQKQRDTNIELSRITKDGNIDKIAYQDALQKLSLYLDNLKNGSTVDINDINQTYQDVLATVSNYQDYIKAKEENDNAIVQLVNDYAAMLMFILDAKIEELDKLENKYLDLYANKVAAESENLEKRRLLAERVNFEQNIENIRIYMNNYYQVLNGLASTIQSNMKAMNQQIVQNLNTISKLFEIAQNVWPNPFKCDARYPAMVKAQLKELEMTRPVDDKMTVGGYQTANGEILKDPQLGSCGPSDIFEFTQYQKFVGKIADVNNPQNGLLLYWIVGTGKTLGFISVADGHFKSVSGYAPAVFQRPNFFGNITFVFLPADTRTSWVKDLAVGGYVETQSNQQIDRLLNYDEYGVDNYIQKEMMPTVFIYTKKFGNIDCFIIGIDYFTHLENRRMPYFLYSVEKRCGTTSILGNYKPNFFENLNFENSMKGKSWSQVNQLKENSPLYIFDEYHTFFKQKKGNFQKDSKEFIRRRDSTNSLYIIDQLHFSKKFGGSGTPIDSDPDLQDFSNMINLLRFLPNNPEKEKFSYSKYWSNQNFSDIVDPTTNQFLDPSKMACFIQGVVSYMTLAFDQTLYPFFEYGLCIHQNSDISNVCVANDANLNANFADDLENDFQPLADSIGGLIVVDPELVKMQEKFRTERIWPKVIPNLITVQVDDTDEIKKMQQFIDYSANLTPKEKDEVRKWNFKFGKQSSRVYRGDFYGINEKSNLMIKIMEKKNQRKHVIVLSRNIEGYDHYILPVLNNLKDNGYQMVTDAFENANFPPYVYRPGSTVGTSIRKHDFEPIPFVPTPATLNRDTASSVEEDAKNYNDNIQKLVDDWYDNHVKWKRYIYLGDLKSAHIALHLSNTYKNFYLELYNDKRNWKGEFIRAIVLTESYLEGINLFDVGYQHMANPSQTTSMEGQAKGRAMRKCAWKNIAYYETISDVDANGNIISTSGGIKPSIVFFTYLAFPATNSKITISPDWEIFKDIYTAQWSISDSVLELMQRHAIDVGLFGEYNGTQVPFSISIDLGGNYNIVDEIMIRAYEITKDPAKLRRYNDYVKRFYNVAEFDPFANLKDPSLQNIQITNPNEAFFKLARSYIEQSFPTNISTQYPQDFIPLLVYWMSRGWTSNNPNAGNIYGPIDDATLKNYVDDLKLKRPLVSAQSLENIEKASDAFEKIADDKIELEKNSYRLSALSGRNMVKPFDFVLVNRYGTADQKKLTPLEFYTQAEKHILRFGYNDYRKVYGLDDKLLQERQRRILQIGPLAKSVAIVPQPPVEQTDSFSPFPGKFTPVANYFTTYFDVSQKSKLHSYARDFAQFFDGKNIPDDLIGVADLLLLAIQDFEQKEPNISYDEMMYAVIATIELENWTFRTSQLGLYGTRLYYAAKNQQQFHICYFLDAQNVILLDYKNSQYNWVNQTKDQYIIEGYAFCSYQRFYLMDFGDLTRFIIGSSFDYADFFNIEAGWRLVNGPLSDSSFKSQHSYNTSLQTRKNMFYKDNFGNIFTQPTLTIPFVTPYYEDLDLTAQITLINNFLAQNQQNQQKLNDEFEAFPPIASMKRQQLDLDKKLQLTFDTTKEFILGPRYPEATVITEPPYVNNPIFILEDRKYFLQPLVDEFQYKFFLEKGKDYRVIFVPQKYQYLLYKWEFST